MEFKNIKFEKTDGVAKIILNRPPVNVMNIEMLDEIEIVLKDLIDDKSVNVLVITGNGKAFSAGVDVADHTKDKVYKMITLFHRLFKLLASLEFPTIAVVNGMAFGGGCEVATFCDFVIAKESAKFGQPEIKVGVFPPIAAVTFPKLCGYRKALELIIFGDTISASEAEKISLIDKVVPDDKFDEEVNNFINKLEEQSAIVTRLAKRAIMKGFYKNFEEGVNLAEDIYLNELMKTEDAEEGLKAFLEKRKAIWKNK
jgi:cyclohexa-1,5-dienecarbonyl-CoA hydratase